MIGDLHCHTKLSDGSCGLEDLIYYGKRAGLDVIAVTDHDTMVGVSRAMVLGKRYGIDVIPGTELSCRDPDTGRRVHLLCYFPQKPNRLDSLFYRIQNSRNRTGNLMIERVMKQYPITKEHVMRYASSSKAIYKVHIMHALMDLGYDTQIYGDLYTLLFDRRSPYNVVEPVDYPTVDEALDYIRIAKGIPVLAHPSVYQSMELLEKLAKERKIMGVEIDHPKNTPEDKAKMREMAKEYGLLVTGGTDFHGFYASGHANPLATGLTMEEDLQKLYRAAENQSMAGLSL